MPVAVVKVGIVRVLVPHRFMPVPVRVGFCHRAIVAVLVVLVMGMGMIVLERFMVMFVVVPFGQMQIQPEPHQYPRADELPGNAVPEYGNCQNGSDERSQ